MNIIKQLLPIVCFLLTSYVEAEQIQIYQQPPSAEEMGRVLFGQQKSEDNVSSERSISFGKKTPSSSTADSSANNSTAESTSVGLPIEFSYNSDKIVEESIPFLEEVGKMLSLDEYANKRIIIEGHTDSQGSDTYNLALSNRRAKAVKQYLINNYQISSSRLKAIGMGESKPLPGYSPEDEANRRVQFYSDN